MRRLALCYIHLILFHNCMDATVGWSLLPTPKHKRFGLKTLLSSSPEPDDTTPVTNNDIEKKTAIAPKSEYGVSYIGGDPCGSRYNTDPHDAKVETPGMPSDMKARIAALAEQRK
eukprot:CAMPEP_0172515950 /NCGR_PEP_ID=MMETSP1066-20121228/272170_1 /TAXON_ID=671091 /ORGANISM="Coscinodiscus wailesii, Strain CCMP2513" /LENGTH=114 /DNA_ID=CAMNT_0013297225 /DNA_START=57 /DNA_END=398 /DNA_ORIENTATION=+